MPERSLFCQLPAECSSLSTTVTGHGALCLIDLCSTATTAVPDGAWVRVRSRRGVPGTGPVVLVGSHTKPLPDRETWLELTEPGSAPPGFAGVVLRGQEAGGPCGSSPVLEMLAAVPQDQAVIVDGGLGPEDAAIAIASGAKGVILADVLMGLPEVGLSASRLGRLGRLDASALHVVNGYQIVASPLSPILRRLLAGEGFWELAQGWFSAPDEMERAWPGGAGLLKAASLAATYGDLESLLGAYSASISKGGSRTLQRPAVQPATASVAAAPSEIPEIAIIGLGCCLPGALDVGTFWDNLKAGKSAIIEVPRERWDWELFWDEDKSTPDKSYAKIGGFLQGFSFNSRLFRIPPNVAKQVAIVQQITLTSVAEALDDAGYGKGRDFDRSRVGVILGNSMGGEVTDDYVVRTRFPAVTAALHKIPAFAKLPDADKATIVAELEEGVKGPLLPITEDSMPGELSNVIAGRVANAFDLCGPNYTVDAACASSMAAVQAAVQSLCTGDVDMVITGGADRSMGIPTYTKFCKIGALSPNQSAPFDADANGFVMGEGAGILVLKRRSDAERDGDRIYALIGGIGASSDGKGKGITAPNPRGQQLALKRAYEDAGVDPVDVDLMECHGTSTVVGDKVEVDSLTEIIGAGRRGSRGPIRIGSVKSNIGHLKSAAGAASCIKASLALHHKTLPPSINFKQARSDVEMDQVPLQVQTTCESWESDRRRMVGVSAFGFGGTNFHIVLQEYLPGVAGKTRAVSTPAAAPVPVPAPAAAVFVPPLLNADLPAGVWGISAMDRDGLIRALESGAEGPFDPSAPVRMAAAAADADARSQQIQRALKVLKKGQPTDLLRPRGLYVEETPSDGKVAFLFTGQGSQYLDMGLDLAAAYPVVQATFDEADAVMQPELGRPLTEFIRRNPELPEEEQFDALRATEISQPATLTVDVGILRLLAAYGVMPDMVAGHSLGEYAAAVAAGMMSFEDALVAVSARGREMAAVQIDDCGQMAGIATSVDKVQAVLAEIPGYVVPANKNCPSQTVIAGASGAVEAAIEAFRSRNITVYPLPVSHAFHSEIVAPASVPLRKVLARLNIQPPVRPITTNVTSRYYPSGEGSRDEVIDILAKQVASPVEWIAQVERMYADGARIFVECGPKRALTGFVASILKRRPHRAIYTNHPKKGGVESVQDALAALTTLGLPVRPIPSEGVPDLFAVAAPRLATSDVLKKKWSTAAALAAPSTEQAAPAAHATPFVVRAVMEVVAQATGYSPTELTMDDELEADLGIDTVKQAEVVAVVRDRFRLEHDPAFRLSDYRTLRDLANYAARRLGSTQPDALEQVLHTTRSLRPSPPSGGPAGAPRDALVALAEGATRAGLDQLDAQDFAASILPAVQGLVQAMVSAKLPAPSPPEPTPPPPPAAAPPVPAGNQAPGAVVAPSPAVDVVCSGASVGLPGGTAVFAPDNIERILNGENRIQQLDVATQDSFLAKNVVRLHKDAKTGQGTFQPVEKREEVIRLAGIKAAFDLAEEYGVDPGWIQALDITTQLAFAAGVEALHDAGIPLVRTYHLTKKGKKVPTGWKLPEPMQATTGIIFASAFPGYDRFAELLLGNGADAEGRFERRFLFQILSMGHSQFAQFIGAQGPNAQANAACASTTQAIAMASDWIQLGRCDRVVVIGADDVTSDALMEWIGTGFLVTGAATTSNEVEEAALPFDARRHGMILGMGAAGLVLEKAPDCAARGVAPLGRLLAARFANSAFHGTRLHPTHIATEMDALVGEAVAKAGVDRAAFASNAMFMSHETYTPAKGGSAAAEIESLRTAFGDAASKVVVTNTKGFTGHPMGAGIEDTVVLKALQYGRVPPIPNLKEPDPDLGDLTLSRGGQIQLKYGIRLAAGFGSQLAMLAWEKVAEGDNRIVDTQAHDRWLREVSGLSHPELVIENRTLRLVEGEAHEVPAEVPAVPPTPAPAVPAGGGSTSAEVMQVLLDVISEKTGYAPDELDPEFELEADLGIDTVKQAEIFGQVREKYGLEQDENFKLADYPTIEALAGWMAAQIGVGASAPEAPEAPEAPVASAPPVAVPEPAPAEAAPVAQSGEAAGDVLQVLLGVISEKTGYAVDELDPEFELEADLGIDTVKQAEIFGQVREKYGLEQDEDFKLADYPTIEALAGWMAAQIGVDSSAPAAAPVASKEAPAPAPTPPEAGPGAEGEATGDVLQVLLEVVSEKTGYAVDELDPEFELEADLGIDTVKQAEIFGQVRERYGLEQDENFKLADYPTIEALAGWMAAQIAEASLGPVETAAPVEEEAAAEVPAPTAPKIDPPAAAAEDPVPLPAPEPPTTSPTVLPESFRLRRTVAVSRPPWAMGSVKGRTVTVLGEGDLADAVRARLTKKGASLEGDPDAVVDLSASVFQSFELGQSLDAARPRDWVCGTQVGLVPGASIAGLNAGARAGFAKAIGREWEETRARVVDADPGMSADEAAAVLCQELAAPDGSVEIFWTGEGRSAIELEVVDLPSKGNSLGDTPVVVLTGGTRGITAQVAQAIADRGPCKLALLARTPPGDTPLDLPAAKAEAKAELEAAGERATPAKVRDQVARQVRSEEARLNLANMVAAGAEVAFFQVDMADPDGVRAALDATREKFGAINGIVHGAGVEESRLIADKDERAFHRVYDGKAIGGQALADALEPDAWFVSMGSVAGRFGNPGQVDYSAANEAMARVCMGRPGSLHVDWTAWGDVGMAVRGGMETLLTSRGVELLPALAGASLLVDMVASGLTGEIVVAGRLGDFGIQPAHGLLDTLDMDGDTILTRRTLSLASDPWIVDHAIDGKPVLPGVIGLELMAATAALAVPGRVYAGATQVAFKAPVKLHGEEPTTLLISAEPAGPDQVRCSLRSERTARTGRVIETDHFEAVVHWSAPQTSGLPAMALPDHPVPADEIYQRFFHGPGFQVLRQATAVTSDALMAEGAVQHATICGGLLTQPLVLEAAFQAAGLHRMMTDGVMALPEHIGQVVNLGRAREGEALRLTVRRTDDLYDVDVDGSEGPVLQLRGFKMVHAGPLPPGKTFEPPKGGFGAAVVARASSAKDGSGAKAMLTEAEVVDLSARGTGRRQADRRLGRVAAKRAVGQLTGQAPTDFEITNDETGKPHARSLDGRSMPALSISHRDGEAIAIATRTGHPGIDLEVVESRPASFAETWFRSSEREWTAGDPRLESQVWAIKEAVLKSLGTGMRLSPVDIEVASVGAGQASVQLWGEARERHAALGGGDMSITIEDHGSMVVAVAWLAS